MVNLPEKWKDPGNGKMYDLTKKNMPVGANIMAHHDQGLCMILHASDEIWRGNQPIPEKRPNTRVACKIEGGYLLVENERLLKMIMNSSAWNDLVGPDPEDPTGFWQQMGVVVARTVKVVVREDIKLTNFEELDLKKLKAPKEATAPLLQVGKGEVSTQLEAEPDGVQA